MSHRRAILRELPPQSAPAPIAVVWAEPPRTPAGHCPKCGKHIGRAIRAHAKDCQDETP